MANNVMKISEYPSQAMISPNLDSDHIIDISIVIPLYNEEDCLQQLHEELVAVLDNLERTYEVVYIDDGSSDETYPILRELHERDNVVRVIRFRRNFGQTAAFSAGFHMARGDYVITMDGDLQNDPKDIALMIKTLEDGFDVVSGWRVDRKDKYLTRRLPSQMANWLISKVTGVKLHDYGCSLKAYRSDVVKNIHLYGEMHRFIPALASWMGINVAEVPVNHRPRKFGRSKYGLQRTVKVILDLLTVKFLLDFATRPGQIFGLVGIACFTVGLSIATYLSFMKIFHAQSLADRPILLLAVLMIMLGVQLTTMGLLGELLVRTYHETQGKPIYAVREVLENDEREESEASLRGI
jgi:glycosyltransferase involved in cell wall biosynthesis